MAEAVLVHLLRERGLGDKISVDSAGTSPYHVGDAPDPRYPVHAQNHLTGNVDPWRAAGTTTSQLNIAGDRFQRQISQSLIIYCAWTTRTCPI